MNETALDYLKRAEIQKLIELNDENAILKTRMSELRTEISALKTKELGLVVELLGKFWTRTIPVLSNGRDIYVDDPIYKQISVPAKVVPIFNQPIFKRLNNVKQLSFGYMTYPTATHSRLSHCLGVARNALRALQIVFSKGVYYTRKGPQRIELKEEERNELLIKAFLVGLLHDLGHGPFGHALDRYRAYCDPKDIRPKPDKYTTVSHIQEYLKQVMLDCQLDYEGILQILDPTKRKRLKRWDAFISEVIDSPLDVDRMDYLVRDSHLTGLTVGSVNTDALIERMIPFCNDDDIIHSYFHSSVVPYVEIFLYARDSMFILCYEEEKKLATERALTKAIQQLCEKANLVDLNKLVLLTDDQLLNILLYMSPQNLASDFLHMFRELVIGAGYSKVAEIKAAKEENPNASSELQAWWDSRQGEEYRRALIDKPLDWENTIAGNAGIEPWQILISVPSDEVYIDKQINAWIVEEIGDEFCPVPITNRSNIMKVMCEKLSMKRQMIRVFVSSQLPSDKKNLARDYAFKLLEKS